MKLVSVADMRALDQAAISGRGIPGRTLMDRAGRGVAGAVLRLAADLGKPRPRVFLAAGCGNNGGDAFAAARYLTETGCACRIWLAGRRDRVAGHAAEHLAMLTSGDPPLRECPAAADWTPDVWDEPVVDIAVDALLGTGAKGAARPPIDAAIRLLNRMGVRAHVVSVDIPSGLDADSGEPGPDTVKADVTVTMGLPKRGLARPAAMAWAGSVEVADIGLPADLVAEVTATAELITAADLAPLFPRRDRAAHKGNYGHVLLIGGSRGLAGAIALAARAACRTGAGLVTALVPASVADRVAAVTAETMTHPGAETATGSLAAAAWEQWHSRLADFDAVLIGPGMTTHADTAALVRQVVRASQAPVVMDADALNVLPLRAVRTAVINARCPLVMTPHPGELARMLRLHTADIQKDRLAAARDGAAAMRSVVVLKGAGTVVQEPGRVPHVNLTGNPGMASGGMGDVLGGVIAALAAQGLSPFDAARAAVYLHGRAADHAARRVSEAGLIAGDVIEAFPAALRELCPR